jgi:hypothetical protein
MRSRIPRSAGDRPEPRPLASVLVLLLAFLTTPSLVHGVPQPQDIEDATFADRPISEVEIRGLGRVSERMVRNNLRTASGQPF